MFRCCFFSWLVAKYWKKQSNLEGAQRVHISAKLRCLCLRPDRNFKFHLCPESRIAWLLSLWQHDVITSPRITACCCDEAKTLETVLHFCTFLLSPHFDLEPHYIVRKAINDVSNDILSVYGNILNLSCTSRIHFSANNTSFCPFKSMGLSVHRHTDRHIKT